MAFALLDASGAVLRDVVTVSGRYVPLVPAEGSRLAYRVAPTVVTRTPARVAFAVQRWDADAEDICANWHTCGVCEMKKTLSVLVIVLGCTTPIASGDTGSATLSVEAPEGKFTGVLTLSFNERVKRYLPERWGLSPLAGYWLSVKIESEAGSYELIPKGVMPKWPHEDGVQSFDAGQQVSVSIDTSGEGKFALESLDGQVVDLLPKGVYKVTTTLTVPRDSRTRRLGLTPLNWTAPEVFLSVD